MNTISNQNLALHISDDGLSTILEDQKRREKWKLDTNTWGFSEDRVPHKLKLLPLTLFQSGMAIKRSESVVQVQYAVPGGSATYTWELLDDCLEVRLLVESARVMRISHPGNFQSNTGDVQLLIPRNQGLLMRNRGVEHHKRRQIGFGVTLSMIGYLGTHGGMVAIEEDIVDKFLVYGKNRRGIYSLFELAQCEVNGWYERKMRLYLTDNNINAVCKQHRRRLIERGVFLGWEEKIQRKPALEKLFGALFAFIGYDHARETVYVKSAKMLKEYGFDTVFYYPVRMNRWSADIQTREDPPIWLSDQEIGDLKTLGGLVSPWTWTFGALEDSTDIEQKVFRLDKEGNKIPHWKINQYQWYEACTPYQIEFVQNQYQGSMKDMDWVHYDVSSHGGGKPCFNPDHDKHGGMPLSAKEDQRWVAQLLGHELNGNRVVSSEGFNEFFTSFYDIASNKFSPVSGRDEPYIPIPMTMLVFHDSTVHNWWEIDTYNKTPFHQSKTWDMDGAAQRNCGEPEKKAAMDALYGCPPLLFPFGRQYGWKNPKTKETFEFEISIQEPEVQRALKAALPVTKLHKKIGKYEMTGFDFITDDCAVQTSTFSDGTCIVANISDKDEKTKEYGLVKANSWRDLST